MEQARAQTTEGRTRRGLVRPLSLLISTIREIGGNGEKESQHKAAFRRLLRNDDYEDFREAIIDEWLRIKYSTALGAAHPPDAKELKRRHAEQQKRREEAENEIKTMKFKIIGKALEMVMPNGKALAQCTGTDCLRFGGWLTRVGEAVGPNRLVGDVLAEKDLARLIQ